MRRLKGWPRLLILGLVGAATSFAFAPYNQWWLTLIGPGLLFWWVAGQSPRSGFASGWFWGVGFFGAGVPWVYNSIHEFGHVVAPAAAFITVGFAMVLALFTGAAMWLASRVTRDRILFVLLAAPACWVLLEWLKSWVLSGFPWLSLGYAHTDSWLAGYAPLAGVFGVSLILVMSAALLAALPLLAARGRIISGLAVLVIWLGGWGSLQLQWSQNEAEPIQVAVLQGNFSQDIKWEPDFLVVQMRWYHNATLDNLDAQLIVWPEAAIPALANRISEQFLLPLSQRAKAAGSAVVLGIPWSDDQGNSYNAVLGLGTSQGIYRKIHLVPLGEYFPFKPLLRLIPGLEHSFFDMTPGAEDQPAFQVNGEAVGLSICYEDAFGSLNRRTLPQAGYLINVTNDAWFGAVAPHQHLQIARMRAIESERWMVRAANTGISAVIDHKGNLAEFSSLNQESVLRSQIDPRSGSTPYVLAGDFVAVLLSLLMLMVVRSKGVPRP